LLSAAETLLERERTAGSADSSLRYMPGLDVVRGLAILMVLAYHGVASHQEVFGLYHSRSITLLRGIFGYGTYGVYLFFVLSGFLITGILIESRDSPGYYKNFYLRRALRILPAYLLMLAVLKSTHWISWRFLLASLLYFSNMSRLFGVGTEYGPLWSLSVEEQFYLTWPLLVRRLSRKSLLRLSIVILVFTPVLRLALLYAPPALHDIHYKTWAVADFFAAGALLAIAARNPDMRVRLLRLAPVLLFSGAALLIGCLLLSPLPNSFAAKLLTALWLEPILLLSGGMVLFGFLRPGVARLPAVRPFIFLAKISYGLYLCHAAIFICMDKYISVYGNPHLGPLPMLFFRFLFESLVAIAVAALSRYTFEEFFLRLKPKHRQALQLHSATDEIT
jgi:peptidoglycan/LPS O-acetylase OafA/YrhL